MKDQTRDSYTRRLLKVIDYMHDHLDDDLRVEVLADVAAMSEYHFHRIYRELVQEQQFPASTSNRTDVTE